MKKLLLAFLILAIAFSAFANGNKEAAAPAAKGEPVVFRYNNGTEPESLDPAVIEGVPSITSTCVFRGACNLQPRDTCR